MFSLFLRKLRMSLFAPCLHGNGGKCYAGRYHSGCAVYFYDETAGGRLFHGKFWFTRKYYSSSLGKLTETARGCFNKGLKEGRWTFSCRTHCLSKRLRVEYVEGKLNGFYSYRSVCSSRTPGFNTGTLKLRFRMFGGHPVDGIMCVFDGNLLTGKCDDDGRPDGLWKMDMSKTPACRIDYEEWEHGVCKSSYSVDESTGRRTGMKNNMPDIVKRLIYNECLPLERLVGRGSSAWDGDF